MVLFGVGTCLLKPSVSIKLLVRVHEARSDTNTRRVARGTRDDVGMR